MAMRTALITPSTSSRRPNPPPISWLWMVTCSGLRPVSLTAAARARVITWVPPQISQASGRTSTV